MKKFEQHIELLKVIDPDFNINKDSYDLEHLEENFEKIFRTMPENDVVVLLYRYGLIGNKKSYKEIGYIINRTPSGTMFIEHRAIRSMRFHWRKNMLKKNYIHSRDKDNPEYSAPEIHIMDRLITDISFDRRIRRCLLQNGIKYVRDISKLRYKDLIKTKGIGDCIILRFLKDLENIGFTDTEWIKFMKVNLKGI